MTRDDDTERNKHGGSLIHSVCCLPSSGQGLSEGSGREPSLNEESSLPALKDGLAPQICLHPAEETAGTAALTHRELAHLPAVHQLALFLWGDGVGHFLGEMERPWVSAHTQ